MLIMLWRSNSDSALHPILRPSEPRRPTFPCGSRMSWFLARKPPSPSPHHKGLCDCDMVLGAAILGKQGGRKGCLLAQRISQLVLQEHFHGSNRCPYPITEQIEGYYPSREHQFTAHTGSNQY